MKVLVCGGRHYANWKLVSKTLTGLENVSLIINGCATGADALSYRWAIHNDTPVCQFPANWQFRGKRAGPMRNLEMLRFARPDLVVAFPGDRGTKHMVDAAKAAGVKVVEIAE